MHTSSVGWIYELLVVASRLHRVASFQLHALKQRLKKAVGLLLQSYGSLFESWIANHSAHESDHRVRNFLISISLTNFWVQIIILDEGWKLHGHVEEAGMGCLINDVDWEHAFLARVDLHLLVPNCFGASRDSHETVLRSQQCKSRSVVILEYGCTFVSDDSLASEEGASHQDLTLDVCVARDIVLGHDTSERVSSHEDVVSRETFLP
jgi:hypothetical protein